MNMANANIKNPTTVIAQISKKSGWLKIPRSASSIVTFSGFGFLGIDEAVIKHTKASANGNEDRASLPLISHSIRPWMKKIAPRALKRNLFTMNSS